MDMNFGKEGKPFKRVCKPTSHSNIPHLTPFKFIGKWHETKELTLKDHFSSMTI